MRPCHGTAHVRSRRVAHAPPERLHAVRRDLAGAVRTGSRVSSQDNTNIDPVTKGSDPSSGPLLPRWRGWLIVIPGIYAGGFVASVLYGAPAKLPGGALGFPVLLHLERAGAVLAAVSVVSTFAHMTSLGHLPSQFGNMIGYPV